MLWISAFVGVPAETINRCRSKGQLRFRLADARSALHSLVMSKSISASIGGLLIIIAATAGWCARPFWENRRCSYMSGDLPLFNGNINRLPPYPKSIPSNLVAGIYKCWSLTTERSRSQIAWQPVLRLKDVRQMKGSKYLLAFELWGVSDSSRLFLVDGNGVVTKAYIYPYSI